MKASGEKKRTARRPASQPLTGRRLQDATEARHQPFEFRKARRDHGRVVDRHRLFRRETHDEEAHGDAVVEMGLDRPAAEAAAVRTPR